jgi:hypothetical protein
MPRVIAAPASRPGNKPASTSPAVELSLVFFGSIDSGLLVAFALLELDAIEVAVIEDVPDEEEAVVGFTLLLDALEEAGCFVESFILHSITSSTHSYPSGQQPLPQFGSG